MCWVYQASVARPVSIVPLTGSPQFPAICSPQPLCPSNTSAAWLVILDCLTLKMKVLRSFETSWATPQQHNLTSQKTSIIHSDIFMKVFDYIVEHTLIHTHIHTHSHTLTLTHTHTHILIHTFTHRHTFTNTHSHTLT